jgi:hypothetical protein
MLKEQKNQKIELSQEQAHPNTALAEDFLVGTAADNVNRKVPGCFGDLTDAQYNLQQNLSRCSGGNFGHRGTTFRLHPASVHREPGDQPRSRFSRYSADIADSLRCHSKNALRIPRTPSQVLNIVYHGGQCSGGFYPDGMNGTVTCQS